LQVEVALKNNHTRQTPLPSFLQQSDQSFDVTLARMGYGLQYVVPVKNGFAAFGLINKYNGPATIRSETWNSNTVRIQLYEGGSFKAYSKTKPKRILLNNKAQAFSYTDKTIAVDIPFALKKPMLQIVW
jgi:hypothetical protein